MNFKIQKSKPISLNLPTVYDSGPARTLNGPAEKLHLVFGTPIRIEYTKFVHLLSYIRGIWKYYEINTVSFQELRPWTLLGAYIAPQLEVMPPLEENSWRRPGNQNIFDQILDIFRSYEKKLDIPGHAI